MRSSSVTHLPIPKNWLEELTYEWLQLNDYLVLSNVRLRSGRRGGSEEADLVGVKVSAGKESSSISIEVLHVEIGALGRSFDENLRLIRKKFGEGRVKVISEFVLDRVGFRRLSSMVSLGYRKLYVATYVPKRQVEELKEELSREEIEFLTLTDLIYRVVRDIRAWKNKQVETGMRRTRNITLPENLWLLIVIDVLRGAGIINTQHC